MQPEHHDHISASTRYRFQKANRESELKDFAKFKQQFTDFLSDDKILALKKVYNHGVIGRNVNQHTVIIDKVGSVKLAQLSKVVSDQQLVGYMNQRMLFLSEIILKQKQQVIWIIDINGPILQLASKRVYSLIEKVIANMHKYFPNILHKLYFVNTPMLFDTIWNKINSNIEESTQQKFILIGDQYQQLYADADPVILPQFLGGTCSNRILQEIQKQKFQKMESPQQEEQDQQIDISQLKAALSGLKIGGNNHGSVAQTPLNTENDEYK